MKEKKVWFHQMIPRTTTSKDGRISGAGDRNGRMSGAGDSQNLTNYADVDTVAAEHVRGILVIDGCLVVWLLGYNNARNVKTSNRARL